MGHRGQAGPPPASAEGTSRSVIFLGIAIVLAFAAVAFAILFSRSGDSSTGGTHPRGVSAASDEDAPPVAVTSAIKAGRYVQAGSFKVLDDAETERQRLAALGIEVQLLRSELAQELYPGFQVLLVGPIQGRGEETATVRKLRHGGVPTAFARELRPAISNVRYGEVVGSWSGTLEEISSAHPSLNRKLTVTARFDSNGHEWELEVSNLHCRLDLIASGSSGSTLSFDQEPACLGSGTWSLRPSGGSLMMTLLPPRNDLIFLGTLKAA